CARYWAYYAMDYW
nr:immunoglobulin heavy chain junction region [Mus musculus]MBK4189562.1 immunoglobulin heavy chain junction region [Mus musculus]MBK4189563.1 immunoglobulin heavy chain junction region [Mus musculus]